MARGRPPLTTNEFNLKKLSYRTPDLDIANVALSQLSYGPNQAELCLSPFRDGSPGETSVRASGSAVSASQRVDFLF